MNTSLKSIHASVETGNTEPSLEPYGGIPSRSSRGQVRGINQIKSKMSALQEEYQKLLLQRQQDIASLIATLGLIHIDDQLLVGGLLFLRDKISTQDPMMEVWHNAGERFLRQTKKQKSLVPSQAAVSASSIHQPSQKSS